jgi:hypothetical protein
MTTRTARALLLGLLLVGGARSSAVADDYDRLRTEGTACYRRRDYRCALARFEAAFALRPAVNMRFNIASARDKLGQHARAVVEYRRYLQEAGLSTQPRALLHIQRRLKQLLARVARLRFSLEPPGARVTLDGEAVDLGASRAGTEAGSPYELVVEPGAHRLAAAAEGFAAFARELQLAAGAVESLAIVLAPPPRPAPTHGVLVVASEPSGARLWIDGIPRPETTPAELVDLAPGQHSLTVATASLAYDAAIRIEAGRKTSVSAALRPRLVRVDCASDPPGARVILDGRELGVTPVSVSGVGAGEHVLAMERDGHRRWQLPLEVTGWSPARWNVRARLEPLPASAAPGRRRMALPLAASLLPIESATVAGAVALYFDLGSSASTAYTLGLEARFPIRDRVELGLNLPLLAHGLFAASGAEERTALGDLRLQLKVKLAGSSRGRFVLASYLHGSLPTSSLELASRAQSVLRPGVAATAQLGPVTLGGDLALQVDVNPSDDAILLPIGAYGALQLGRYFQAQLGVQLAPALRPRLEGLALAFSPAVAFSPVAALSLSAGARIAATDEGRLLLCRGAARALLLVNAGYAF